MKKTLKQFSKENKGKVFFKDFPLFKGRFLRGADGRIIICIPVSCAVLSYEDTKRYAKLEFFEKRLKRLQKVLFNKYKKDLYHNYIELW